MRLARWPFFVAALMCLTASLAHAAGLQLITVEADKSGSVAAGAVWYPCSEPTMNLQFGLVWLPATGGCPLPEGKHPLVVISHGLGGTWHDLHDVAETLADAGFIVAAINHPGDFRDSETRHPRDFSSFSERPTDIKRLIDYMLGAWPGAAKIDPARIGFFGFSRGGLTGLALIGGDPDWQMLLSHEGCPATGGPDWCREVQAQFASRSALTRDARVKAAVLADRPWGRNYTVTGLQNVMTPVQIWASERGFPPGEVMPGEVAIIAENLPVKPDYRLVPNSWHLDFVPACGPASAPLAHNSGSPDPCADANGFDRDAFHHQFDAAILAFFQKHLAAVVSSAQ